MQTNKLHLHLFGTPQFTYQGKPSTGFVSNKVRALLIYLAVTGRAHSRDALAELLWPDTPDTARINLRKALSNLRRVDGVLLVEESTETVALDPHTYRLDVAEFAQVVTGEQTLDMVQQATQLYRDDFLSGFNTSVSYEFEAWALNEQRRLQTQMIGLLERLIAAHEQAGELPAAIATARRLLAMEPWREKTHYQLMTLLAQSGDRSAALAQFQYCVDALHTELNVDPTSQTRERYEQIRTGTYPAPAATPTATVPPVTLPLATQGAEAQPTAPRFSFLPTPPTQLVGRQPILMAIAALLQRDAVRLVTLTGTGGVGKTRLALEIGRTLLSRFADGALFVELAPIQATPLVAVAIADALGIRESAGNRPLPQHIIDYLRDKELLLIVDNFEHLLETAPLIGTLLAGAPKVKILVTSRARLHLRGEFEFAVPPLHLPPLHLPPLHVPPLHVPDSAAAPAQPAAPQQLATVESVQLFVQQAQAVQPHFALDATTAPHVADICTRLDGLPLAIELAAARTKVLEVAAIAERLEARFALLQRGPRDAPVRHQTLQNAIDWSYDLLTAEEQLLLRRLSVFVGGCTLGAVEAIWPAADGTERTLDLVTSLVDKSLLLRQDPEAGAPRFTQLETLLAYGQVKLRTAGELAAAQDAHAGYFLQLAEEAEPMLFGGEQVTWLARLGREHDNLRAALRWLLQKGDAATAARLGIALWHYWYIRVHHLEGTAWLEQILERELPTVERAKVLYGLGMLARRRLDDETVIQRLSEALDLFRQVKDDYYTASVQRVLGFIDYRKGDLKPAQQKLREALALFRKLANQEGIAVTLTNLGYVEAQQFNYAVAQPLFEESLALRRRSGNQHGIANCLDALGAMHIHQKNYQAAKLVLTESWNIYQAIGNRQAEGTPLHLLGAVAYIEGDYRNASATFEQAYARATRSKNNEWLAELHLLRAVTSFRLGHQRKAASLLSDALRYHRQSNLLEKITVGLMVASLLVLAMDECLDGLRLAARALQNPEQGRMHILFSAIYDELQRAVADQLRQTHDEGSKAWAEGKTMTLDEAMGVALDLLASGK